MSYDLSDKVGFERFVGTNSFYWQGRIGHSSDHVFDLYESYAQRQSLAGVRLKGISINYSIRTNIDGNLPNLRMWMAYDYEDFTEAFTLVKLRGWHETKSLEMGEYNTVVFDFGDESVLEVASLSYTSFAIITSFDQYDNDHGRYATSLIIHSIFGTLEENGINELNLGNETLNAGSWMVGAGWARRS